VTRASTPTLSAPAPADDRRQRILDAALKRNGFRQDALLQVLHSAQSTFGFLTPELLWYVAAQLKLPPSRVYGVATFYNFFSLEPPGEHTVTVCQGTVCYIRGARGIATRLSEVFGIRLGETSTDGRLSATEARCLGSCGLAPVVVIDGRLVGRVTPDEAVARVTSALEAVSA
jgi:bidirectional [NiFe] hydrogenase diaphorase subunit